MKCSTSKTEEIVTREVDLQSICLGPNFAWHVLWIIQLLTMTVINIINLFAVHIQTLLFNRDSFSNSIS